MALTRRHFLYGSIAVGSLAAAFGTETRRVLARGNANCTIPTPAEAIRFVPDEPRVVPRVSVAELSGPGREDELRRFREAVGLVMGLSTFDVLSWDLLVAAHCQNCAPNRGQNIHSDWRFLLLASRATDLFVAAVDDAGRTRGAAIPLAASRLTLMS